MNYNEVCVRRACVSKYQLPYPLQFFGFFYDTTLTRVLSNRDTVGERGITSSSRTHLAEELGDVVDGVVDDDPGRLVVVVLVDFGAREQFLLGHF